ncbi:TPA: hypothetical protein VCH52_001694 [Streptococcus pyogenes]|nr:hypothetical protein [Streptococcus pyogenes]
MITKEVLSVKGVVPVKTIQIVEYWHRTSYGKRVRKLCGIKIIDEQTGYSFEPTYPFAEKEHREDLQEFIDLYEKDLLDFYVNEVNVNLGRSLALANWQVSSDSTLRKTADSMDRDHFCNYWFKRGVIFY